MADQTKNVAVPSADEVEALRREWVALGKAVGEAGEEMASFGGGVLGSEASASAAARFQTLRVQHEAKWNEYQDAVARRLEAQRADEIRATNALATTNATLARRQFWLAIVIAAATVVQAAAAVHGPWSGAGRGSSGPCAAGTASGAR